jgi:hypothetical protein
MSVPYSIRGYIESSPSTSIVIARADSSARGNLTVLLPLKIRGTKGGYESSSPLVIAVIRSPERSEGEAKNLPATKRKLHAAISSPFTPIVIASPLPLVILVSRSSERSEGEARQSPLP